ncbi:MAG: UDP-N-acetylglucosamine transferase subunit [Thelocarpon superellum]|nr:MAG: UDP-N-acetylglucosamine transferase subunit [Thelocarpon superellum]
MLAMLRNIDTTLYTHRSYVVSEGDAFSRQKALEFEAQLADRNPSPATARGQTNGRPVDEVPPSYDIVTIPRARKIHQSLLTTPISAFHCLAACFRVLYSPASSPSQPGYPDLIVTNGPGTAVCVILACLITRFFGLRGSAGRMRTIYVESWARVRRLSLSGKILIRCVDRFLVQWQGLRGVAGRAEFIGVLV